MYPWFQLRLWLTHLNTKLNTITVHLAIFIKNKVLHTRMVTYNPCGIHKSRK